MFSEQKSHDSQEYGLWGWWGHFWRKYSTNWIKIWISIAFRNMAEITFEKFSSKCKQEFVDLNLAWLKDSFAVEPHDVAVLEDCEVFVDDEFTENCSVLHYFSLGKHFGAWWPNSPRKTRRGGNFPCSFFSHENTYSTESKFQRWLLLWLWWLETLARETLNWVLWDDQTGFNIFEF